ncbi:hypothetical protein ACXOSO_00120 [Streptococcus thermophilus]
MNWKHIWELFKINLPYANPQAVTSLQKRQKKKKKANFSIVNAMLRQQLLILIIFTIIYSYLFVGIDYKANPGVSNPISLDIFSYGTSPDIYSSL